MQPTRSAADLNFAVLKRLDPAVEEVLASPGHVALYDYDTAAGTWKRKDVEGSLFLLRRATAPVYQLFILNKKGTVNYSEDVRGGFQFEDAAPYLLYRNARDEVVGVWFYDKDAIAGVVAQLQSLAAGSDAPAVPTPPAAPAAAAAAPGGDAFWDTPASLPAGYDPLGGGGAAAGAPAAPPAAPPAAASGNRLASLLSSAAAARGGAGAAAPPPPPSQPPSAPTPRADGAAQGAALTALLQGGGAAAAPAPPAAASRDTVRRALLALAGDDAFLDAVAARLAAAL